MGFGAWVFMDLYYLGINMDTYCCSRAKLCQSLKTSTYSYLPNKYFNKRFGFVIVMIIYIYITLFISFIYTYEEDKLPHHENSY